MRGTSRRERRHARLDGADVATSMELPLPMALATVGSPSQNHGTVALVVLFLLGDGPFALLHSPAWI